MSPICLRPDWNGNETEHEFNDVNEALTHIKKHPSYEIIGEGNVRPYGDLDCKKFVGTEAEFWEVDTKLQCVVSDFFKSAGREVCITNSSKYPVMSLRWYVPDCYVASRLHAKEFARDFYSRVELPSCITTDYSVYSSYKKMRTFYTSKPGEVRPFTLLQGEVQDTLITYIPENAEKLDFDLPPVPTSIDRPRVVKDELLLKVVEALPLKFLDAYADWITIGMVLFNEGFELEDWDAVSQRSASYDGSCKMHWNSFKSVARKVTGATLWKWLKETNPVQFWALIETRPDFWKLIEQLNNHSTAEFFYNIHPDAYLFNEGIGWFALGEGNVWKSYDKSTPHGLLSNIAKTFQDLAMDTKKAELATYKKESENETDKEKQKALTEKNALRMSTISRAYIKFGSKDFCSGVISFLSSFYNDERLDEKMDKNSKLFAFTNGVYDLEKSEFRPIVPTDYISVTTGYEYDKHSNPDVRKELKAFFFSLFEDEQTVQYLLSVLASCLLGANKFQEFYVFTGSGGNGKSLLMLLVKFVFGDYITSVEPTLLTKQTEGPDRPCAPLVNAKYARLMVSSEPEATDKLQVGLLKKLSGGDVLSVRTLSNKFIHSFIPMFKLIVLANDIPALSKIDGGIQRRMKVLLFPFGFKVEGECVADFHRKKNMDLEGKMTSVEWRDELILMLIETYKGLKVAPSCPAVEQQSKEYLDENNPLKEWLAEKYILGGTNGIPPRELKRSYLDDNQLESIDDKRFKALLGFNGITQKKSNGVMKYTGLTRKEQEE
jgi:P4 family phage/plasmid primase-like protien